MRASPRFRLRASIVAFWRREGAPAAACVVVCLCACLIAVLRHRSQLLGACAGFRASSTLRLSLIRPFAPTPSQVASARVERPVLFCCPSPVASLSTLHCQFRSYHRNALANQPARISIPAVSVASASAVSAANVQDFRTGQDTAVQSFLPAAVSSARSCIWRWRNARMCNGTVVYSRRHNSICCSSAST